MMNIIWNILLQTVFIFLVAQILPGFRIKSLKTALVVSVVYSIVNYLLGTLLVFLSAPLLFLTLGLFMIVVNAILLKITDLILSDFKINGTFTLLLAAVLISVGNSVLRWIF